MGTMNKMRENTGVVLWVLVIAFGILWVIQDTGVMDTVQNPGQDIIVVDGEGITYEEYSSALDQQMEAYRQQTGESMPPQRVEQEQERVFNMLVEDRLREREMDRLGITVTDEEVRELVLGENPHPLISIYFGDGQGSVDRALLQNFIDEAQNNPEVEQQLIQLESYLRAQRRREKLNSLITSTVRVSELEIEEEHRKQTHRVTADFYALRYADVPDDSVTLTDADLRTFYNQNREDFARERSYTLQIASLSKQPTAEDTTVVLEDLMELRGTFAATDDDSLFLARYGSERPYASAFFSVADLDAPLADAIFANPQADTVIGPVIVGTEAHLVKILETRPAEETAVKARHILVQAPQDNEEQRAAARQEALDLKQRIEAGEDFATLARQHSDDTGSGALGGDLGWFGPGRMVEPFQDAAFDAPIGQIVGPVETRFGYHLIEVLDRAEQEVRIADYAQQLRPSVTTLNTAQERLDDLQYYAEETGNFEAEAERLGLELQTLQVEQGQEVIPGIGTSRSLMTFLETARQGDISEVIELNDQFIVASVQEITPEGYRPFEEVQDELRPRALLERKQEIQRERLEQAYQQYGFDELGQVPGLTRRTANNVSANNTVISYLGRDPIFTGTVLGLDEGQESGVVEGTSAAFVANVTSVTEPPPLTDEQRAQIRERLLTQRRNQVQSQWIATLRENAAVRDLRGQFLQ